LKIKYGANLTVYYSLIVHDVIIIIKCKFNNMPLLADTWTTIDERKATKKKLNDTKSQRLREQLYRQDIYNLTKK